MTYDCDLKINNNNLTFSENLVFNSLRMFVFVLNFKLLSHIKYYVLNILITRFLHLGHESE